MTGITAQSARRGIVAFMLLLVAGCAGRDTGKIDDPLKLKKVSIIMEAGANDNRPARVELVRVPDSRLIAELVGIEADEWFGGEGEKFRSANPEAVYDRWEPVPGLNSGPHHVKVRGKFAGVLFCQTENGSPPFRVVHDGDMTVLIDDVGCRIEGGRREESIWNRLRRSKRVELSFGVPAEANRNRPVRVELVRVGDAELVEALTRLAGSAWFGEGGRDFRRRNPDALVDDWELVPGAAYGPFRFGVNANVDGILFCGKTASPPLRIDWDRKMEVEIDNGGCRLSERVGNRGRWNPLTWGGWE